MIQSNVLLATAPVRYCYVYVEVDLQFSLCNQCIKSSALLSTVPQVQYFYVDTVVDHSSVVAIDI